MLHYESIKKYPLSKKKEARGRGKAGGEAVVTSDKNSYYFSIFFRKRKRIFAFHCIEKMREYKPSMRGFFAGKIFVLLKSQCPYNQPRLALKKLMGLTQPRSLFCPLV